MDVVVVRRFIVLHVLALVGEDLLICWYMLFFLNFAFNLCDQLVLLDVQGDGLAVDGLDEDLPWLRCFGLPGRNR